MDHPARFEGRITALGNWRDRPGVEEANLTLMVSMSVVVPL